MNRNSFLRELAKFKGQFQIGPGKDVRTKEEYACTYYGRKHLCPIEVLTLKDGLANYVEEAEILLGLQDGLTALIIGAADGCGGRKENRMRARILEALDLKEESSAAS